MTLYDICELAGECRTRRKPSPARCADCANHGAADCAWSLEVTPTQRPAPPRRELTLEERVHRLFAEVTSC